MMPPLDRYGNGQPEYVINHEDWTLGYYYNDMIFDNMSTLAPSVATDPVSHDLLITSSEAGRGPENYFSGEDSIHAETDLQIFRTSPDFFPLFNSLGTAENIMYPSALAELPLIRGFQLSDHQPQTGTVNGELALPPDESLQMSVTTASSLEQEEELVDAQRTSIEDIITSCPLPELYPALEYPHDSDVSAASPCPNHPSKSGRKRKRSDAENKHTAEIRISKKIPWSGKLPKDKAWLGTYATAAQKERALDVGKFFLCTKKKKNFFYSNSEVLLSPFVVHLRALPLPEFVDVVTKMAKLYGEHGLLPECLHGL